MTTTLTTALSTEILSPPRMELTAEQKRRRLLDDFFAGLNLNTLRTYRQSLTDFASFVGAADGESAAGLLIAGGHGEANHLALAYRASMVERDLPANTINNRLTALRSLVKLACTLGLIEWTIDIANVKTKPYRDTAVGFTEGRRR
jgi:hypothetical protein